MFKNYLIIGIVFLFKFYLYFRKTINTMQAEIRNTGEILEVKKITKEFIALFYKTPVKTLFDIEMEYCVLPRNKVILIP